MFLQNEYFDDDDDDYNPVDDGAGRNFHLSKMHFGFLIGLLHYNTLNSWNVRACQTSIELTASHRYF